jgi:hypothetical protein
MPVEPLATPAELRLWLGLPDDATEELSDPAAELLIAGVSRQVLAYTRRSSFTTSTSTVRVAGTGSSTLILPGWPVSAVTAVVEDPDGAAPGELVDYVEWSEDGVLELLSGGRWAARRRFYEITFEHGYAEVPEDVRNLVLRVAARAFANPEGLATEGVGGYNAGFAFDDTRLPTLSAPDRRELEPYVL